MITAIMPSDFIQQDTRKTRSQAAGCDELQVRAAALLLRSPRLSVSLILELLDIGDAEFRMLTRDNPQIAELLEQRRRGELTAEQPDLKTCPGCGEWFIPYAGARCCSDECTRITQISANA